MTGNVEEINGDAFNWGKHVSQHIIRENAKGRPSIRGRTLYVPINAYAGHDKCAFPLISLSTTSCLLVTLRPIQELIQLTCSIPTTISRPAHFNLERFQMYRFLQPRPA
jgi:hypothetical protein